MKVLELIENDEFKSQQITLDHLNKAQKAACYQFYVYLTQLKKKYPESLLPSWMFLSTKKSLSITMPTSLLSTVPTNQEKAKYKVKYDNMIKAKKAYEAAGGDYEEKLKESDDEFESQEITLDHLDKAQKAACHQLCVYLIQLKKKYPKIDVSSWLVLLSWPSYWSSRWLSNVNNVNQYVIRASLTDQEKAKYQSKCDNMIKAKEAYEKAGGIYITESEDEFKSQPLDLNHLDKVQKAASHQFYVYVMQLKKKYPDLFLPWYWSLSLLLTTMTPEYMLPLTPSLSRRSWSSITDQEKAKYEFKYNNMIQAKQAFTKAWLAKP